MALKLFKIAKLRLNDGIYSGSVYVPVKVYQPVSKTGHIGRSGGKTVRQDVVPAEDEEYIRIVLGRFKVVG